MSRSYKLLLTFAKFWTARSRLYRSRFLRVSMHFAAFFKLHRLRYLRTSATLESNLQTTNSLVTCKNYGYNNNNSNLSGEHSICPGLNKGLLGWGASLKPLHSRSDLRQEKADPLSRRRVHILIFHQIRWLEPLLLRCHNMICNEAASSRGKCSLLEPHGWTLSRNCCDP